MQRQAVANIVCDFNLACNPIDIQIWVDALHADELEPGNIDDIRDALQPAADLHYDRAMKAKSLDLTIHELDECLCANPEPPLARLAYYNLSAAIWEKFHFNERKGAEIADDEYLWVRGCNICLRWALKIYEHMPRSSQLEAQTVELHHRVKGSLGATIFKGSFVYSYGQREFRKVRGLPALRCLTEIDMPID